MSEGSPISPVFKDPKKLAEYISHTRWGADKGTSKEQWLKFILGPGWAPSLVADSQHGVMDDVTAAAIWEDEKVKVDNEESQLTEDDGAWDGIDTLAEDEYWTEDAGYVVQEPSDSLYDVNDDVEEEAAIRGEQEEGSCYMDDEFYDHRCDSLWDGVEPWEDGE